MLNFIKNVCTGGFIASIFIADNTQVDTMAKNSRFGRFAHMVLNGLPKPITLPGHFPQRLSGALRGSFFIGTLADNLAAPVPLGKKGASWLYVLQWGIFIFPAAGVAAVIFATPFLPTMLLGAMLLPILFVILFSRPFVINSLAVFLLGFIALSFIVAWFSFARGHSLQIVMLTSIFIMGAMAVVAVATTQKAVDFMLLVFVASAGFTGIIGVYQFLFGDTGTLWIDTELHAGLSNRIGSTFGNPNVFATYLLLLIPIAAAGVVYFKGWFLKFCALGATFLLLGNLLLTYTRGAYLALPLAIAVFIMLMEKRFIVLMIASLPVAFIALPASVTSRLLSIVNLTDTSTIFRMSIWQGSIRMIGDFWLAGVGQGLEAYHTVYPYYALAGAGTLHSHNLFLQILVEVGVPGFLLFVGILACFFRAVSTLYRNTTQLRVKIMAAAMISAMVAFLIQSFFDYSFFNYSIVLTFYLYVGLGIALARVYKEGALQDA